MEQENNRVGWVCPKCGAVMNPDATVCVNCVGNKELYCEINIEQPKIINNLDQIKYLRGE